MKKPLLVFLVLIAALLSVLAGCCKESEKELITAPEIEKTFSTSIPASFDLVAVPAEDGCYYLASGSQEESGLFHRSTSGKTEKCLDGVFSHLTRYEDSLFFIDGDKLCSYHIKTKAKETLISDCRDYVIWEGLFYFRDAASHDALKKLTREGKIESVSSDRADEYCVAAGKLFYTGFEFDPDSSMHLTVVFKDDGAFACSKETRSMHQSFINSENGTVLFLEESGASELVDLKTGKSLSSGRHDLTPDEFYGLHNALILKASAVPAECSSWIMAEAGDGYVLVSFPAPARSTENEAASTGAYRLLVDSAGNASIISVN